jgi:hypothetical protein
MFGAKLMIPVDMKAAAIAEGCGDISKDGSKEVDSELKMR